MKYNRGFTMIELIVVIVILGILAATALPRFISVQTDARAAAVNGARGAVQSASALAHAAWLVAGSSSATTVTMDGATVTLVNGYPTADANGILTAAQMSSDFTTSGGGAGAGAVLTVRSSSGPTTCSFTYTAAGAGGSPSVSAAVTASNC